MSQPEPAYTEFTALKRKKKARLRRAGQVLLMRGFIFMVSCLPLRWAQQVGAGLGHLAFYIARHERAIAEYQLGLAFPTWSAAAKRRMAQACFRHLGTTLFETLGIAAIKKRPTNWLKLEGGEALRAAHSQGKGVILVVGHIGNWELLSVIMDCLKLPARAMVRSVSHATLNAILLKLRQSSYLSVIQRGTSTSPRHLLACLKQGDILVVALDHDVDVAGVFVDFFGIPANTPQVAASLALKGKRPLFVGLDERQANGTHHFSFKPITPPTGLKAGPEGLKTLTALLSQQLEGQIRKTPAQWTWPHRRWKRRPSA